MPLDSHLGHRFSIQRDTSNAKDVYNNTTPTWTTVATDVHGRLIEDAQRTVQSETVQSLVTSTYTLLVLGDVDLAEGDRVTNVVYEDGNLDPRTFKVSGVVIRRGGQVARHASATLEVVE